MKYMLDANVIRHVAHEEHGYQNIIDRLAEIDPKDLYISTIAVAELHAFINSKSNQRTHRAVALSMLSQMKVCGFNRKAAEGAGRLKAEYQTAGRTLPTPDYMIAGHAMHLGCVMVTDNTRHFAGITGLKVENWLRPK